MAIRKFAFLLVLVTASGTAAGAGWSWDAGWLIQKIHRIVQQDSPASPKPLVAPKATVQPGGTHVNR